MECNKEEAEKAKQIAESRMQRGEFVEALKFALKAKRMYAELENIAQILTICEVHNAAQKKLSAAVMDWYGILQTERLADEAAIKKQYRKLALLLHPDKNKFPGAETAFKFIGEAYRVLSDPAKKASHDIKYGVFVNLAAPKAQTSSHHSNGNVSAANHQKGSYPNSNCWNPHQLPQTFWAFCKHCKAKFQYFPKLLNAAWLCTNCLKSFAAPTQCPPKPASESKVGKPCASGVGAQFKGEKCKGMKSQTTANAGSKRMRQSAQVSRESFNAGNGDGKKDANVGENDVDPSRLNVRRSSRQKQHVSYVESPEAGKFRSPSKKPRQNGSFDTNETEKENVPTDDNNGAGYAAGVVDQNKEVGNKISSPPDETSLRNKSKSEQSQGEKVLESDLDVRSSKDDNCSQLNPVTIPDTDFNDFDKDKEEDCFAVNQFWAIYDSTDGMPRFYALVRKVATPFKLKISWLEPDPDDEGEIDWHDAELPIACGKFKLGGSETVTDRTMFSHQIQCMKRSSKGSYYMVYPKKGETWALFRDWDIKWSATPENYLKNEIECVEILSDFTENVGIEVAHLVKVNGFVSLFQKTEKNGVSISCVGPNELYRFSHRIPSYKTTGNEREGVPRGCFELDTAALPTYFFVVGDSEDAERDPQSWKHHQRDRTSMNIGQQTVGTVAAC
ncbi:uncharacterized protein LOC130720193 [Lotus japonicus]|uniref:uncharacterized protein LOC130720193 n=1 Tax=Lotus japonicus TaxID=34305 RepID=UPI00258E54A9|nr:uncharacterized protein LOC130720193 [Lotus japonicus]